MRVAIDAENTTIALYVCLRDLNSWSKETDTALRHQAGKIDPFVEQIINLFQTRIHLKARVPTVDISHTNRKNIIISNFTVELCIILEIYLEEYLIHEGINSHVASVHVYL